MSKMQLLNGENLERAKQETIFNVLVQGRSVAQIPASSPRAVARISELGRQYGYIEIEEIKNSNDAMMLLGFSG